MKLTITIPTVAQVKEALSTRVAAAQAQVETRAATEADRVKAKWNNTLYKLMFNRRDVI